MCGKKLCNFGVSTETQTFPYHVKALPVFTLDLHHCLSLGNLASLRILPVTSVNESDPLWPVILIGIHMIGKSVWGRRISSCRFLNGFTLVTWIHSTDDWTAADLKGTSLWAIASYIIILLKIQMWALRMCILSHSMFINSSYEMPLNPVCMFSFLFNRFAGIHYMTSYTS